MRRTKTTPEQLQEKRAEILSNWPLYRPFVYTGKDCHAANTSAVGRPRFGLLPKQLRLFCDNERCGYKSLWEIRDPEVYFGGSEFIKRDSYTCRNCGKNTVTYCYIWQERKENNFFLKVGQYPELEEGCSIR